MNNNEIYKYAFKQFVLFVFWLLVARLSSGAILVVMILFGISWAFMNKVEVYESSEVTKRGG